MRGQCWRFGVHAVGVLGLAAPCLAACEKGSSNPPPLGDSRPVGGSGGTGGSGGASGSSGTGGSGGTGVTVPPLDTPCSGALGHWASGMSFATPTPQALAVALNELTFDSSEHPLAVAMLVRPGSETVLAVSASELASDGISQTFPPGKTPALVNGAFFEGGFRSIDPQPLAWLRVRDVAGLVDIELRNLRVEASTQSACSSVSVNLQAGIPQSQGAIVLHLASGDRTIEELAGGPPVGVVDWPLRAFFGGEQIDFDFAVYDEGAD